MTQPPLHKHHRGPVIPVWLCSTVTLIVLGVLALRLVVAPAMWRALDSRWQEEDVQMLVDGVPSWHGTTRVVLEYGGGGWNAEPRSLRVEEHSSRDTPPMFVRRVPATRSTEECRVVRTKQWSAAGLLAADVGASQIALCDPDGNCWMLIDTALGTSADVRRLSMFALITRDDDFNEDDVLRIVRDAGAAAIAPRAGATSGDGAFAQVGGLPTDRDLLETIEQGGRTAADLARRVALAGGAVVYPESYRAITR